MTTYLGTYINGEVKLDFKEEQAAPIISTWNEKGQFLSSERLDSIGSDPFDAFVYTYNTDGSIKSYVNCSGDRNEILYYVEYEYDLKGKKLKEIYCNSQFKCDSYWQYLYDSLGNLISETLLQQDQIQRKHTIKISYKDSTIQQKEIKHYEGHILVVHRMEKYRNDLLTIQEDLLRGSTWSYTYNEDETVNTETSNFGDGDKVYYNYYVYDDNNNPILKVNCDESGFGLIETITYEYF